ncbi:hypothetical protein ACLB2K_032505 [Fragaria x ananassa]
MQTHHTISWFSQFTLLSVLLLLLFFKIASGFGSMGPISASFGESSFFCAIDASGKQAVWFWHTPSSDNPTASEAAAAEVAGISEAAGIADEAGRAGSPEFLGA